MPQNYLKCSLKKGMAFDRLQVDLRHSNTAVTLIELPPVYYNKQSKQTSTFRIVDLINLLAPKTNILALVLKNESYSMKNMHLDI